MAKRDSLQKAAQTSWAAHHGSICVRREHSHPLVFIDGKRFVDFTSFDYFGLNKDQRIKESLFESTKIHEWATGSTRRMYGTSQEILNLETELASFLQTRSALTFNSRNQAVFSLITNVVTERDCFIIDIDSTAPVVDAAFQVGATVHSIDLTDINWLENVRGLSKRHPLGGKVYCYFEEISSIHGGKIAKDFAIESLKAMNIIPICDVTYSLGLSAPSLTPPATSLEATKEHFVVGSFGFSLPGIGAFIAGGETIDRIRGLSSTLLNEPSLPPVIAKFNLSSVSFLSELCVKAPLLLDRAKEFRMKIAHSTPVQLDLSAQSPILTFTFNSAEAAKALLEQLQTAHILGTRVARGILRSELSLVRVILGLSHTEEQMLSVVRTLSEVRRR